MPSALNKDLKIHKMSSGAILISPFFIKSCTERLKEYHIQINLGKQRTGKLQFHHIWMDNENFISLCLKTWSEKEQNKRFINKLKEKQQLIKNQ